MKRYVLFGLLAAFSAGGAAQDKQTALGAAATLDKAAAYCEQAGGKVVKIRQPGKTGAGLTARCLLPSGEFIDTWKLYNRVRNSGK